MVTIVPFLCVDIPNYKPISTPPKNPFYWLCREKLMPLKLEYTHVHSTHCTCNQKTSVPMLSVNDVNYPDRLFC